MIIYKDKLSGDEFLSDSYEIEEIMDGFFYQVEGKWVVVGEAEVDIGANPSAEGGGEDESIDPSSKRVVDLIDAARLQETQYDKKSFMAYVKTWVKAVADHLPEDKVAEFKEKAPEAVKYLVGKIKELQFFMGENMDAEGTMAYAYYKDGASNPTFLFPAYALDEVKC